MQWSQNHADITSSFRTVGKFVPHIVFSTCHIPPLTTGATAKAGLKHVQTSDVHLQDSPMCSKPSEASLDPLGVLSSILSS